MTITKREVQPKARITYDEMEAFLTLPVPKEGGRIYFRGIACTVRKESDPSWD